MSDKKDELSTAQRQPRGQPYSPMPTPGGRSGGVDYKTPPNAPLEDEEQVYSKLTPDGRFELPDGVPMEPPLGYSAGPSLADFVQRTIRNSLSQIAEEQEMDTFEEGEDFDIEDDPVDPLTPYESVFYGPPPSPPSAPQQPPAAGGGGAGEGVVSQRSDDPAPATPPPNEKA